MSKILLSDSLSGSTNVEWQGWNLSYLLTKALELKDSQFINSEYGMSLKCRNNKLIIKFQSFCLVGFDKKLEFVDPLRLFIQTLYGECYWDYNYNGLLEIIKYIWFEIKL